jgi:hypothetical protein
MEDLKSALADKDYLSKLLSWKTPFSQEEKSLILSTLVSKSSLVARYFDALEKGQSLDSRDVETLGEATRSLVLKDFYKSTPNEEWESMLKRYTRHKQEIKDLIKDDLWFTKNFETKNYDVVDLKNKAVLFSLPLKTTREILAEAGLDLLHPMFNLYLAHLFTDQYRQSLAVNYIFSHFIASLKNP